MRKLTWSCAAVALSLALLASAANAEPWALDTTFGGDGTVTTSVTPAGGFDAAYAVATQADKIVAIGQAGDAFAAVRYDANGMVDPSFGDGGKTITPIGAHAAAYAAIVQPDDGKIVAAGVTNNAAFAVVRYTRHGRPDDTFGKGGLVITEFTGGPDIAYAIARQPDGKIVVAGQAGTGGDNDIALARYESDGTLDPTFGDKGKVITARKGWDTAYAVAIQDRNVLIAGESAGAFTLARYDATGELDPTFGTQGLITTGDGSASAMTLQNDGKIIVAGTSGGSFAVARFDHTGQPDKTFGHNGMTITSPSSGTARAWGVALHKNGEITLAGELDDGFGLARYRSDGIPDQTFDDDGMLITDFTNETDSAYGIAIEPDEKLVLAGAAGESGDRADFAVARYNTSPPATT